MDGAGMWKATIWTVRLFLTTLLGARYVRNRNRTEKQEWSWFTSFHSYVLAEWRRDTSFFRCLKYSYVPLRHDSENGCLKTSWRKYNFFSWLRWKLCHLVTEDIRCLCFVKNMIPVVLIVLFALRFLTPEIFLWCYTMGMLKNLTGLQLCLLCGGLACNKHR